ncbi:hypothetical protein DL93DRAFT_2153747 [Clavulina sp. PMI_390]|nr:hypothetical protein DL93DRAFT_2153747 [Clavulina sp. PMI_390]
MDARLVSPITLTDINDTDALEPVAESILKASFTHLAASPTTALGVIDGCEDGSFFILRFNDSGDYESNARQSIPVTGPSPDASIISSTARTHTSAASAISASTSKKASSSYSAPQNLITSPTHAASDLNAVPVEAPKVFVDHHDEEAKLRALLGQGAENKNIAPSKPPPANLDKSASHIRADSAGRQTVKPLKSKFMIQGVRSPSVASSREGSPGARSRNVSSSLPRSLPYQVQYHVVPSHTGPNEGVTAVEFLSNGEQIIVLQESGNIGIYSVKDGRSLISLSLEGPPRCRSPDGWDTVPLDTRAWKWTKLDVLSTPSDESVIIGLMANDPYEFSQLDVASGDLPWSTRIAVLKLNFPYLQDYQPVGDQAIELLAEWVTPAPVSGCGIFKLDKESGAEWAFFKVSDSHISISDLTIEGRLPRMQDSPNESRVDLLTGAANALQSIPQNLAAFSKELRLQFRPRHPRQPSLYLQGKEEMQKLPSGRITLASPEDVAVVPEACLAVKGSHFWPVSLLDGFSASFSVWSNKTITIYAIDDGLAVSPLVSFDPGVGDIDLVDVGQDGRVSVVGPEGFAVFEVTEDPTGSSPRTTCIKRQGKTSGQIRCKSSAGVLSFHNAQSPALYIQSPISNASQTVGENLLWRAARPEQISPLDESRRRVVSLLPLELRSMIVGFSDGYIGFTTFSNILQGRNTTPPAISDQPLDAPVTGLHTTKSHEGDPCVVGSCDDGSFAVWDIGTLKLRARWTIFCTSLRHVITLPDDHAGRLKGCMICVADDGTLAVITLDAFELLYVVPGSVAPIERICVGADNLLLLYGNARTRLWDTRTLEFWRSMGQDKVVELLDQGGWFDFVVERSRPFSVSPLLSHIEHHSDTFDMGRTMLLDFSRLMEDLHQLLQTMKNHKHPKNTENPDAKPDDGRRLFLDASEAIFVLRTVLANTMTFGIDSSIDKLCEEALSIPVPTGAIGTFNSDGSIVIHRSRSPSSPWEVSAVSTSMRLLLILLSLGGILSLSGPSQAANDVISFYVHRLPDAVGEKYEAPSLTFLASLWFDPSVEVRQVARTLFDAAVASSSDEATLKQLNSLQHHLPILLPDLERDSSIARLSLVLCANVAIEKVSMVSPSTLSDISKSIMFYLHDDASPHRVVAVDAGARGFHIWQNYISAMELLRSLFRLTTPSNQGTLSSAEKERGRAIAQSARSGVLHIAASATPLFVSTILVDIMDATSIVHCNTTMHLLAFIIRKKPAILQQNLPRLVEAVVKSLDPNSSAKRDAVLESAIEFLSEVVSTYPTIDFHVPSQKLAVGTSEGAILMYDLKSASRLYVLEGQKKRIDACTFSPDGRRLVTVCLEESTVMVWKVGASFSNFFSLPGAPPRQGGASGSEPYRTFPISMPPITPDPREDPDAPPVVAFEWPAARSARLTIRQNVFTFATHPPGFRFLAITVCLVVVAPSTMSMVFDGRWTPMYIPENIDHQVSNAGLSAGQDLSMSMGHQDAYPLPNPQSHSSPPPEMGPGSPCPTLDPSDSVSQTNSPPQSSSDLDDEEEDEEYPRQTTDEHNMKVLAQILGGSERFQKRQRMDRMNRLRGRGRGAAPGRPSAPGATNPNVRAPAAPAPAPAPPGRPANASPPFTQSISLPPPPKVATQPQQQQQISSIEHRLFPTQTQAAGSAAQQQQQQARPASNPNIPSIDPGFTPPADPFAEPSISPSMPPNNVASRPTSSVNQNINTTPIKRFFISNILPREDNPSLPTINSAELSVAVKDADGCHTSPEVWPSEPIPIDIASVHNPVDLGDLHAQVVAQGIPWCHLLPLHHNPAQSFSNTSVYNRLCWQLNSSYAFLRVSFPQLEPPGPFVGRPAIERGITIYSIQVPSQNGNSNLQLVAALFMHGPMPTTRPLTNPDPNPSMVTLKAPVVSPGGIAPLPRYPPQGPVVQEYRNGWTLGPPEQTSPVSQVSGASNEHANRAASMPDQPKNRHELLDISRRARGVQFEQQWDPASIMPSLNYQDLNAAPAPHVNNSRSEVQHAAPQPPSPSHQQTQSQQPSQPQFQSQIPAQPFQFHLPNQSLHQTQPAEGQGIFDFHSPTSPTSAHTSFPPPAALQAALPPNPFQPSDDHQQFSFDPNQWNNATYGFNATNNMQNGQGQQSASAPGTQFNPQAYLQNQFSFSNPIPNTQMQDVQFQSGAMPPAASGSSHDMYTMLQSQSFGHMAVPMNEFPSQAAQPQQSLQHNPQLDPQIQQFFNQSGGDWSQYPQTQGGYGGTGQY